MTETKKGTTAKRKRPPAKKKEERKLPATPTGINHGPEMYGESKAYEGNEDLIEKTKEEPKASIIHIPISPTESLTLAKGVEDQYTLLAMPTPKKFIKKRKGKAGMEYDYVEANYVISRLNATFLYNWDFEVLEYIIDKEQDMIALMGKLTVRFLDGRTITKTAWGGSDLKHLTKWDEHSGQKIKTDKLLDLSSDLKSAQSDCIKKCSSLAGLCWDIFAGYGQQEIEEPWIEEEKVEEKPVEPRTDGDSVPTIIEAEIVDESEAEDVEPPIVEQEDPPIPIPEDPEQPKLEPISKDEGEEIVASEQRQAIKDYVRKHLETIYGKKGMEVSYKSIKLFLYGWQGTRLNDAGEPRKFVDMNQYNNISLMLGNLEDLRMLKLHWKYILSEWKKWSNESGNIPF